MLGLLTQTSTLALPHTPLLQVLAQLVDLLRQYPGGLTVCRVLRRRTAL